ncbi:MAG: hypothetical protein KGH70_08755, partial [Rhodospirillales bacterium]|nr:hypothetical protein [Rhodospirillales bacterium]
MASPIGLPKKHNILLRMKYFDNFTIDTSVRIFCLKIAQAANPPERGIHNIVTDASLLEGFIRNGYLQIEKEEANRD